MSQSSRIEVAPRGYRVLFELGRGGMGAAYLARAEGAGGFERLVVIKRIRPERLDPRSVERFLREARVAAAIHHVNVVSAQNVGQDSEGPFIVLDYVEGASLEELLDRALASKQLIPVPIALRIALDALAGLEAVHDASDASGKPLHILHRDISLQNVLVGRDGVARLLDFGIARSTLGGATTDALYIVGKLPYLPPEYLRRETLLGSADVYGLGVTLWLALSGADLWAGASEAQVLQHILVDGVPPLSQVIDVAPEVVALVARSTAADREQRFHTARDMAAAIEQLGRERGWVATHHEVAEWLEAQYGAELARRRERVASIAKSEAPSRPERPASVAVAVPVAPVRARRSRVALIAVCALLVTAAVAWALSRPTRKVIAAPSPTPLTQAAPAPSSSVVIDAAPPTPPAPPGSVEPAAPPTTVKRPSTKTTAPRIESSRAPGVRPPDQISKRNPYRE
jgi:eukaryotic-like serine/threonine-protein kinase